MKIIIAPDSFKGALRADKVASALAEGWRSVRREDELLLIPMSDGGEGLAAALAAARGGQWIGFPAHDALMRPVTAKTVQLADGCAILESAEANGIELLTAEELDPMSATTYGVGEVMRALLHSGCSDMIVGIGGSATVDGGAGMIQALGGRLLDPRGRELPPGAGGGVLRHVAAVDLSGLDAGLKGCRIKVACDVTNPLCGAEGSAAVFGPQKGATPEMAASLDENLRHWAALFGDDGSHPGDGAAGGLGFALRRILRGELISGARLVMRYSGFEDALAGADMVITGEGCSDEQTVCGKLCACVAERAGEAGVPTVLLSGALRGDTAALEKCFRGCFSIAPGPVSLAEAIAGTAGNLRRMGANLAHLAGCGKK